MIGMSAKPDGGCTNCAASGQLDAAAREKLATIARSHRDPTRIQRALWALHVTGGVPEDVAAAATASENDYVRSWVVRLAAEGQGDEGAERKPVMLVHAAALDRSPVVRLAAAAAAQRLEPAQRWEIVESLAGDAEDAADHNLPLMYWYAMEPLADVDPQRRWRWLGNAATRFRYCGSS